jgi:cobalt-zinc-cadmium efflux system membrane fusion protein
MRKISSIICLGLLLSITSLLFTSCGSETNKKVVGREKYIIPDSIMKTLAIDTVKQCQLVDAIALTSTVDFNQDKQINVYPLVSGNIQDIKVELGDYVTEGQVLGVVKSSEMAGYSKP